MHGEADLAAALRRQLERAVSRRRLPWRLLPLVPAAAALPVQPYGALALAGVVGAWALWDRRAWRERIAREWPRWLDDAVPALEDSSALLAGTAASPLARVQRQRIAARADAIERGQYDAIARRHTGMPFAPSLLAAAACAALWLWPGATPSPPTSVP